jgi:heat shock protein HslJ
MVLMIFTNKLKSKSMKYLIKLILINTLLLSACSKEMVEADAMKNSVLKQSELLGQWKFKSYADGKTPAFDVTLEIKDEAGKYAFSGRSSVNFYFTSPKIDESKKSISIEDVGSTKIAGSFEANQFEAAYYENLRNVERYELKDKNTLVFYLSKPAKEAMFFEKK